MRRLDRRRRRRRAGLGVHLVERVHRQVEPHEHRQQRREPPRDDERAKHDAPPQPQAGRPDAQPQAVEPPRALLREIGDGKRRLLVHAPVRPPKRHPAIGDEEGEVRVLGDAPRDAVVEPDVSLDRVVHRAVRPVHADERLAEEPVLKRELAVIVRHAHRVGERGDPVLRRPEVRVVQNRALTHRAVRITRRREVRVLVVTVLGILDVELLRRIDREYA